MFGYQHSSQYLFLCYIEDRKSNRFGTTWGWINDDRVFMSGWIIPVRFNVCSFLCSLTFFLTQLNVKRQLKVIRLISQSWNYVNLFVWAIWHVLAQPILGLLGLDFLFCEQWLVRKIKNDDWFIHKLFLESDLFNETLMNQSEWFLINLTDQVLTKLKVKNSHPFSCCYWCYCKRFIHACVVSEELEYSAKVIYYVWFFSMVFGALKTSVPVYCNWISFQNILFCVPLNKESHTGLEQQEALSTVLLLCNLENYFYSDEQNAVSAFDIISHLTL